MFYNKLIYNNINVLIASIFLSAFIFGSQAIALEIAPEPETSSAAETVTDEAEAAPVDPGMQIPVDGSSLEAFNKSLATIKTKAQEANYVSLEGAIDYLLVYDIGARGDKAKLAKNLDGLTGEQIIAKVARSE